MLGCPSELDGTTQLLKMPLYFGYRSRRNEIQVLPPCRLAFVVLEAAMQDSKRGKQPIVLPSYDAYKPYQQ